MIGIASDHAGFETKEYLISYLKEQNYEIIDYGTTNNDSVDYPLYALKVGEAVKENRIEYGILICKTGIGMSIACNKVKGVRCAKIDNIEEAILSRKHNDSNVIALSSMRDKEDLKKIVKTFLSTTFSNEERHVKRINIIKDYENEY